MRATIWEEYMAPDAKLLRQYGKKRAVGEIVPRPMKQRKAETKSGLVSSRLMSSDIDAVRNFLAPTQHFFKPDPRLKRSPLLAESRLLKESGMLKPKIKGKKSLKALQQELSYKRQELAEKKHLLKELEGMPELADDPRGAHTLMFDIVHEKDIEHTPTLRRLLQFAETPTHQHWSQQVISDWEKFLDEPTPTKMKGIIPEVASTPMPQPTASTPARFHFDTSTPEGKKIKKQLLRHRAQKTPQKSKSELDIDVPSPFPPTTKQKHLFLTTPSPAQTRGQTGVVQPTTRTTPLGLGKGFATKTLKPPPKMSKEEIKWFREK